MKKPVLKDFKLQSFKIWKDGGAEIRFSYLQAVGSEAHHNKFDPYKCETYVQEEIIDLLDRQKPNIIKVEGIRYRQMAEELLKQGVDHSDVIMEMANNMTIDSMKNIVVTGFSISGVEDKTAVKITYKRYQDDNQVTGHTTSRIMLSKSVYGFEDELKEDVDNLVKEIYAYVYQGKHAGSSQMVLPIWEDSENEIKSEDDEENESEETTKKDE